MKKILLYGSGAILAFFLFFVSSTQVSAETKTRIPRTGENIASVGTIAWTNPDNITGNDVISAVASSVPAGGGITNYLQGTDFRFSNVPIPDDAFIQGIRLRIKRFSSSDGTGQRLRDSVVSLMKNGIIVGDNKAVTSTNWPTDFAVRAYGGENDLWGTTWTPADINTSTFGAVLSAANNNGSLARTGTVDYFQVVVYYFRTSTLEVGDATGIYGGSVNLTATLTPAVSGQSIVFSLNGTDVGTSTIDINGVAMLSDASLSGIDVGAYPTGVGAVFAGDDYYVSSTASNTLTISAKPLTITALDKNKYVGEVDPVLTYTSSDSSASFSGSLTRTTGETSGTYEIQQGTLAIVGTNYFINSFVPAYLTIQHKGGSSLPDGFNLPPIAPVGGFSVHLSDNKQTTSNRIVTLNLSGGSAVRMAISNFSDFRFAGQIPYSPIINWNICEGKESCVWGINKIYVKFFTQYGYSSETLVFEVNYTGQDIEKIEDSNEFFVGGEYNQDDILALINSIKIGERNEKVKQLQTILKNKDFFRYSTATGYYGNITKQAIIDYLISIKKDGLGSLVKIIRYGERSEAIKYVQTQLKEMGFFEYPTITGFYGAITQKAINDYLAIQ